MGTISLVIPQIGQPDTTEDVKVQNAFTTIQAVINGNIDDTNLKSPNGSLRRLILQDTNFITGIGGAGTGTVGNPSSIWWGDSGLSSQPQDYQVANKTAFGRIRAVVLTNTIAPGVTLTFGLYPITSVSGGAGVITFGFGTVVTGSTIAIVPSIGGTGFPGESAQFTLPTSSGAFVLGVNYSGATAAGSAMTITSQLLAYNA